MDVTPSLPTGTVTFLLTDIEGSTRLWEEHADTMRLALVRHDTILTVSIQEHGGVIVRTRGEGDSFFAVFARATDAVAAACAFQQALQQEPWPTPIPLRVRVGINTGEAELRQGDYYGPAINRCARIRALGVGGQTLLGRTTYELAREGLPLQASLQDLGAHRLKDLQRPEQLFQLLHPDLPSDFPPLTSLDSLPNNLPLQVTSFIGRDREMAEVQRLLGTTGLLTLTGPGGTGKTRLALQVAADLLPEYPDGAWFVELASLSDPDLVPQTVASQLGIREAAGQPLTQTLVDALQARKLLLVLDNCEHLIPACAALANAVLRRCPGLKLLATSREGINIAGETIYRLPSLSLPDLRERSVSAESLSQYEAVRLFIDRARASQPSFAVTNTNAPAVAQVCHQLDGIPLAIELAAVRVRVLSVEQIMARLDDRFRLLTGGSRAALPRHQTLRAAIDWSYDLLSEAERALLQQLSVFAGGFTLEMAEAVCTGKAMEVSDVLSLLGQLVDKSLVVAEETVPGARLQAPGPDESGAASHSAHHRTGSREPGVGSGNEATMRYRLLETIRQYGAEHLRHAGEEATLRDRHRDCCLELAEKAEPELTGRGQGEWLARLEREHENLRAALAWSSERGAGEERIDRDSGQRRGPGPGEAGLRLGGALWRFWSLRGYVMEGRERLAGLLALPGAEGCAPARAKALNGAGILAHYQGDFAAARAFLEESLTIGRALNDQERIAAALHGLGLVARFQGDDAAARSLHEESLTIYRQVGNRRGVAAALYNLGILARLQEEYEAARQLQAESLLLNQEVGDKRGIALSFGSLGQLALSQGNYAEARSLHEKALSTHQEVGDKEGIAFSLMHLGDIAQAQEEYAAARSLYEESLALGRELGDRWGIAMLLARLGNVAGRQGEQGVARALLEDSLAIRRALGDRRGIAGSLYGLGQVIRDQGDCLAARSLFRESLAIRYDMRSRPGILECLAALAEVATMLGEWEQAARLFGVAETLRDALGGPLSPAERIDLQRHVAAARAELSEDAFASAWEAGRVMSLEEAMCAALAEDEIPTTGRQGSEEDPGVTELT
jgi:predicted ATPase/class 3 adenylate cyclase